MRTDDGDHPDHDVGEGGDPDDRHDERQHVPAAPATRPAVGHREEEDE